MAAFLCITSISASEVKTASKFCRKKEDSAKYTLKFRLDKGFNKYKIKVLFNRPDKKKIVKKYCCYNSKYFAKKYSYDEVGFNTTVKVIIKKYKTIIKEEKIVLDKAKPASLCAVNCENIIGNISSNKDTRSQKLNTTLAIPNPKCKTVAYKEVIVKNTLSKQDALVNFSHNEDDSIYSQPKRTLTGFYDCSSFVYTAYNAIGLKFSEHVGNTETILSYCENNGARVNLGSLKKGDIILYFDKDTDTFDSHYKHVTHVALYVGNGQVFEYSGTGVNCRLRNVGFYESSSGGKAFRVLDVTSEEISRSKALIAKEEAIEKAKEKAKLKKEKKKKAGRKKKHKKSKKKKKSERN